MQLLLTDRLACPRCGPAFGLILLANAMVHRRVGEGVLGCPNCRDSFPIGDGFADVRPPPRGPLESGRAGPAPSVWTHPGEAPVDDRVEAERLVALLGIARGPGTVALIGWPARFGAFLARTVDDLLVVAVDPDTRDWPEASGVSRMAAGPGLPFFDRVLRGVVVDGSLGDAALFEAGRITAPMSRVVVIGGDARAADVLVEAGLSVMARDAETVVAARS
jgi:uncharacterized protein YbaR (Trm112 family)